MSRERSAYLQAIQFDNSIPIEQEAVELWLKDLDNPMRWTVRPFLQVIFALLLHITWFLKRLPLPQFSAHETLQKLICWFCKYFVSYEANMLILRHYATESNILNFLASNSPANNSFDGSPEPLQLYPKTIEEMLDSSFVQHDQELFRMFKDLGYWQTPESAKPEEEIDWSHWLSFQNDDFQIEKRPTQFLDFESAHALFMCLFCMLLKKDEYRDAINGFNLDQSIAIRIGDIVGRDFSEQAYNKYPLYLVGPWNLSQRFLMHGFFTEYLYASLEQMRKQNHHSEA